MSAYQQRQFEDAQQQVRASARKGSGRKGVARRSNGGKGAAAGGIGNEGGGGNTAPRPSLYDEVMRADTRAIFKAASLAGKAADYLIGLAPATAERASGSAMEAGTGPASPTIGGAGQ